MKIEKFEDIKSWQLALELVVEIYSIECKTDYGIDIGFKDQIQRASVSIMSNIAEGFERGSNKEFIKFLYIAKGSCQEVRSLLHVGNKIGYIWEKSYLKLLNMVEEISKTISGLIKYLGNS
jgi:four helix bundle protein